MNASDKIKNTFKIVHMFFMFYVIKCELLHMMDIRVINIMSFYRNWILTTLGGRHSDEVDIEIKT